MLVSRLHRRHFEFAHFFFLDVFSLFLFQHTIALALYHVVEATDHFYCASTVRNDLVVCSNPPDFESFDIILAHIGLGSHTHIFYRLPFLFSIRRCSFVWNFFHFIFNGDSNVTMTFAFYRLLALVSDEMKNLQVSFSSVAHVDDNRHSTLFIGLSTNARTRTTLHVDITFLFSWTNRVRRLSNVHKWLTKIANAFRFFFRSLAKLFWIVLSFCGTLKR